MDISNHNWWNWWKGWHCIHDALYIYGRKPSFFKIFVRFVVFTVWNGIINLFVFLETAFYFYSKGYIQYSYLWKLLVFSLQLASPACMRTSLVTALQEVIFWLLWPGSLLLFSFNKFVLQCKVGVTIATALVLGHPCETGDTLQCYFQQDLGAQNSIVGGKVSFISFLRSLFFFM